MIWSKRWERFKVRGNIGGAQAPSVGFVVSRERALLESKIPWGSLSLLVSLLLLLSLFP